MSDEEWVCPDCGGGSNAHKLGCKQDRLRPRAAWTPDCQGKQDFDGPIISVSTRYWPGPGGGGPMVVETRPGRTPKITEGTYGDSPSATSAIILRLGPKEEHDGGGDYMIWREQDFRAPTEAEVKALVEDWVHEMMVDIMTALGGRRAFRQP